MGNNLSSILVRLQYFPSLSNTNLLTDDQSFQVFSLIEARSLRSLYPIQIPRLMKIMSITPELLESSALIGGILGKMTSEGEDIFEDAGDLRWNVTLTYFSLA